MEEMDRLVDHANKTHAQPAHNPDGWDAVINQHHLKVWRRFMPHYNLYEYRGIHPILLLFILSGCSHHDLSFRFI
jgi:hypothetical protein